MRKLLSKHIFSVLFAKRLFSLLLVLALLPAFPLFTKAEAKTPKTLFGSDLLDKSDSISSMALQGDTLYILTQQSLYAYTPGDEKARLLAPWETNQDAQAGLETEFTPTLSYLLSDGERLLGFDMADQKLYETAVADGKIQMTNPVQLEMEDFLQGEEPYRYFSMPAWMRILDGKLYAKFYNYENLETDLYSFDLKTGAKTAHKPTHLVAMTPYKDGAYLAVLKDPNRYYDDATGERVWPELVIYNPADESVVKHPSGFKFDKSEAEIYNLYYDAQEDSLYTNTDTDLYRLDGDFTSPRLVGYLPMFGSYMQVSSSILPLPDGRLAIPAGQNVFLRERTEEGLTGVTALTMIGSLDDPEVLNRIMMEMDNVVVRRMEGAEYNQLNAEQMATLFLTGNIPADLINISAQAFDIDKLIEKGYLADLSGNASVAAFTGTLAPNLSKFFQRDGKIFTVPSNTMVMPVVIYPARFEAVGLTPPTSLTELLDVVEEWVGGVGEQYPDYSLLEPNENLKTSLRYFIFERYMSNVLGANGELVFDTPVFRQLAERVESIDYGDFAQDVSEEQAMDQAYWEEMSQKKQLMEINVGYDLSYMVQKSRYERGDDSGYSVVLSLEPGTDAHLESDFSLMMVLSTSKNRDLAVEFLGHLVDKLNPVVKAALNPEMTEPIINPFYEQEAAQFEKYIANMESQLKTADGAVKSNLEQAIKSAREEQAYQAEQNKYLATADALKAVHSYLTSVFIVSGLANAQRQVFYENYELREQYYSGAISLDQFIKQMDDKLRLVRMEYQ